MTLTSAPDTFAAVPEPTIATGTVPTSPPVADEGATHLSHDADTYSAADEHDAVVCVPIDLAVYSRDAVFRACYKYTDRCYLLLRRGEGERLLVDVRRRPSSGSVGVRLVDFAGEFMNELIDQQLRVDLERETRPVRELIVAQAFAEARFATE